MAQVNRKSILLRHILQILIVASAFAASAQSQEDRALTSDASNDQAAEEFYYIVAGDSLAIESINLNEVVILKRLTFDDNEARRRYITLRRRTLKVFPYAKLAAERLTIMEERLAALTRKSARKKYTRRVQRYVEEELSATLRKFTRSEGRILVKLIERQTGRTAYDLIKTLRSGWRAYWYDKAAGLYDISLKESFRPFDLKEDYYIEEILQRAFRSQILEPQAPHQPIDILALEAFWHDSHQKEKRPTQGP